VCGLWREVNDVRRNSGGSVREGGAVAHGQWRSERHRQAVQAVACAGSAGERRRMRCGVGTVVAALAGAVQAARAASCGGSVAERRRGVGERGRGGVKREREIEAGGVGKKYI
jgi:hypothetical protein